LLNLPDNDLWDLVIGRARIEDAGCAEISFPGFFSLLEEVAGN